MSTTFATVERAIDTSDLDFDAEFDRLVSYAEARARAYNVPYEVSSETISLWKDHYRADRESAKGAAESIPIALAVADVLNEEIPDPTDRGRVVMGTLIHDCGKPKVGKSTLDKSNKGEEWDYDVDMSIMEPHAIYGAILIMSSDLSMRDRVSAAKKTAESHAKQKRGPYSYINMLYKLYPEEMDEYSESEDPTQLSFRERRERDCENIGDFVQAMWSRRNNTRNSGKSDEECWAMIYEHIVHVFEDYYNGRDLADKVYMRIWTSFEQDAESFVRTLGGVAAMAA